MKMGKPPDRSTVLIATTVGTFLITFNGSALNVALPRIGSELSMDAISLSWIVTGYILTSVMVVVPFGRIADIYGRKKIFTWGLIVFVVTSVLQAMATTGIMLITLRLIQGIGGALINSTYIAMLTSAFPVGERGKALGINATAVYAGFSLGPFLGGLLTQHFGWRSIFSPLIVLGLFLIVLIFWRLKGDWVEAKGERFDIVGSLIYSLTLIAIVYGFTHLPDMFGIWLILVGVLALVAFVIWETKTVNPILEINLFRRSRTFAFCCLAAMINYGATYAVSFLLSLYLQYIKGFSPQTAGLILIANPVVQVIFSMFAGRLSDRIQPRKVASAGMILSVIGLLHFVFLSVETDMLQILAGLVLTGLGIAFFASPNLNALMSSVEKKFFGIASATITTMRQLGMVLSMGIVMLLFAFYMGSTQITPEYYGMFLQSVNMVFIIFTILCFLGIFASLASGKPGKASQT
jgi:EmrB/QacA subfamily drug resistance transporter